MNRMNKEESKKNTRKNTHTKWSSPHTHTQHGIIVPSAYATHTPYIHWGRYFQGHPLCEEKRLNKQMQWGVEGVGVEEMVPQTHLHTHTITHLHRCVIKNAI